MKLPQETYIVWLYKGDTSGSKNSKTNNKKHIIF